MLITAVCLLFLIKLQWPKNDDVAIKSSSFQFHLAPTPKNHRSTKHILHPNQWPCAEITKYRRCFLSVCKNTFWALPDELFSEDTTRHRREPSWLREERRTFQMSLCLSSKRRYQMSGHTMKTRPNARHV